MAGGSTLLIRADAGSRIGTGHVMRCLALAQAWQDAGRQAVFLLAGAPSPLEARLATEGMTLEYVREEPGSMADAARTTELAQQKGASWVVVDGYHFGADFQAAIKEAGLRVLAVDDWGHAGHYPADLVLNQNLHARASLYPGRGAETGLLLGPRYMLLRREYFRWRGWRREIAPLASRLLVTVGGSDPDNLTARVMHAVRAAGIDGLEVIVVVGAASPHHASLAACVTKGMQILADVKDMPGLMRWADLAIGAGGTTAWESAFMQLPAIVIEIANNQHEVAERLHAHGAAISLGRADRLSQNQLADSLRELLRDQARRQRMAAAAATLIDGEGCHRVVTRLQAGLLGLRPAARTDCRLFWEWACDQQVRAMSFDSRPISWEDHAQWFGQRLESPSSRLYVGLDDSHTPVGQVRFDDVNEREAEVSISVAGSKRGCGLGAALLVAATEGYLKESRVAVVHGYVKENNSASRRAFIKADFHSRGVETVRGHRAVHFVRERHHEG